LVGQFVEGGPERFCLLDREPEGVGDLGEALGGLLGAMTRLALGQSLVPTSLPF